jgi:hypothetical protein
MTRKHRLVEPCRASSQKSRWQRIRSDITGMCERQAAGTDFRARRELVPGSMTVHVIGDYGAMQMGTHRFFALQAGKPDRLTETGKFIDLWKREGETWKLARVISYDHRLAE